MGLIMEIVQILTLIALVIYVIKTWQIASANKKMVEEIRESRLQENRPYVMAYFDIPYGEVIIYFVIKNVGKSIARNVKLKCEPILKTTRENIINFGELDIFKNGITEIPPSYELKTVFDTTINYFDDKKNMPLTFDLKISYCGGLSNELIEYQQALDLRPFKGLMFIKEKGIDALVERVEKIMNSHRNIENAVKHISDRMDHGIWIKNFEFLTPNLEREDAYWKHIVSAKLSEFKVIWDQFYRQDEEKLLNPSFSDLKNRLNTMGDQILAATLISSLNLQDDLREKLINVAINLKELGLFELFADGGESCRRLNEIGNQIIKDIDQLIVKVSS